jgi:trehalose 6-phosphate synthase/phosphatase
MWYILPLKDCCKDSQTIQENTFNDFFMKIINISNRLPITFQKKDNKIKIKTTSGGLVSAVQSLASEDNELHWVGVADFSKEDWSLEGSQYEDNFILHPVFVEEELYKLYYEGFSNSVLWPLFHYFPSFVEYRKDYFDAYLEMNLLISEQIKELIEPDDLVWIHDYHLIPLIAHLRRSVPNAKIGFFLHIPFPSYELIRILPKNCRDILITGLLGADLVGFHTYDYVQHFATTIQMIAGIQHKNFQLQYEGRMIRLEAFPISIDFKKFNSAYSTPKVTGERNKIRNLYKGKKIIFSVDRLDYTKGIIYRLRGYARFLKNNPEWKEKVVFILIAVPTRHSVSKYAERKEIIEKLIGNINGQYGNYKWSPIVYQYGSVDFDQLLGLYTACDVALISPVRDGMNLVAKEFIASRDDKRGVLLLSDMTGAAKELTESLLFNPLDETEVSFRIKEALIMPAEEQKKRLEIMQNQICKNDIFKWGRRFIAELENIKLHSGVSKQFGPDDKLEILKKYHEAINCLVILDYDGTLVEIKYHPDEAIPDENVKTLLSKLNANDKNKIVVISGRKKDFLESWFGTIPITLVAEHGIFAKREEWENILSEPTPWMDDVKNIMERFSENCAFTFVEEKTKSLSWHYRNADPESGFAQSRELINLLSDYLISTNVNILDGKKVIEVKPLMANKGEALKRIIDFSKYDFLICIGDDKTDEDMFEVVNYHGGITMKVGEGYSIAQYRVDTVSEVMSFLSNLT